MSLQRRLSGSLVVALAGLAATGCGGHDAPSDQARVRVGEQVFASSGCATCHTLTAADATGTIGPNLDQLRPSAEEVARRVHMGGNGMPSFARRLSDAEIDAVAAYVAAVARQQ